MDPQTGVPWTLHGVSHQHQAVRPFSDFPGIQPFAPLTLFVKLRSRARRLSLPRELVAHLFRSDGTRICSYRFETRRYRPDVIVYMTVPVHLPTSYTVGGWHEFLLVLDDEAATLLARTEVYLIR